MLFVPYSHFIFSSVFVVLLTAGIWLYFPLAVISGSQTSSTLREGVVMGVNAEGNVQLLNRVNPIVPTNIQLEKDLTELIYQPLLQYSLSSDGSSEIKVEPILADEIIKFREGADYQFKLRKDVLWHDGQQFNADDVIRTFDIVSSLNISNAYVQAIKQLQWEKIDEFNVRICTQDPNRSVSCDASENSPIFSNFLELVSIFILPEHLSNDINAQSINTADPVLFRRPIGTGPYVFESANPSSARVTYFKNYYGWEAPPQIQNIVFELFKTIDDAVIALKNGEIHSLSTISVEFVNDLKEYNFIQINNSDTIDQQYWGLYFNLRTTPDGDAVGKDFLLDSMVREAIMKAININGLIDNALQDSAQQALGPISYRSEFFNAASLWIGEDYEIVVETLQNNSYSYNPQKSWEENKSEMNQILYENEIVSPGEEKWLEYNQEQASALLDETGWTFKPSEQYRTNSEGEVMEFNLYFVNSYDRQNVANYIKEDLATIGIKVNTNRKEHPGQDSSETGPEGWTLDELNNQILAPRLFDVLLYGMNTFVDPDRFELFHSSQQTHPGLNIAGYEGSVEGVQVLSIDEREGDEGLVRVPKIDRILDETRSFDPVAAKDRRLEEYFEFQSLLMQDFPVAFLYHPQFIYYTNKNISNVDISSANSLQERFATINLWGL